MVHGRLLNCKQIEMEPSVCSVSLNLIEDTDTIWKWSERPVRTAQNIERVKELILSEDDEPGTYTSQHEAVQH